MKLSFVRHGESEANVLGVISNRGRVHGLTEQGREQAATLAATLRGTQVHALYSSPLLRAVETAEILGQALGLGYEITDALREYDCGEIEGRSDPASWQRHSELAQRWRDEEHWGERIAGGESFFDIQQRFVPFIEQLVQQYRQTQAHIVLVGHGGTYRCMLPLVLTNIDRTFAHQQGIPHTASIVAELRPEGLICTRWGALQIP